MYKNRILIVGSQHGDETLGLELFEYLKLHFPEFRSNVEYVCANPEAYKNKVRFIDSDMNRSYALHTDPRPYEELRADDIIEFIRAGEYDFVLDVHTTTTEVGLCLISTMGHEALLPKFANASAIQNIVLIPDAIADHSLIGNVEHAISIECNVLLATDTSILESLALFVNNLGMGKDQPSMMRDLYYVDEFINPEDSYESEDLQNFKVASNGKYPILSGGKANRTYRGFWASKKRSLSY